MALLSAPEPDDPQDAEVAKQYKENIEEFNKTAKFWAETYATGIQTKDAKVQALVEMGFEEKQVKEALAACDNNQERALEYILANM